MKATITSKGQITIPAQIRERLGLKAGQVLEFDEKAGFIKAYPLVDMAKARSVLGCAKNALRGYTTEQWLSATRGRRVRLIK
ncbi:MAG: AbrB/MazE/SpoVT family DNA-binding domain-containing protein [Verrucomicrobiota bacterium]|nr:AbrB/MazE/SpoVT family DNA-binding domain-containing protein [Verrucomicrobiota bacterium]MDQ6940475.1 AbrB/MazE/SpoVT family DNA-binding domain-containing protein [Verrucomicrobiota bacterium]